MQHGQIVAEASADGKKNRWHVRWEGLDASQAESREQKLTAGGIPSTKLTLALAVSGSDEDNSDGDNASYEESDSSDSIGGSVEEDDDEDDDKDGDPHLKARPRTTS